MLILDIGCGDQPYVAKDNETVITCDIRPEVKPNVICDVRELPFETEYFDRVRASHVLEHFSRNETHKVLDGWVRVLKTGGELEIIVPDIMWAAERLILTNWDCNKRNTIYDEDTVISILYGDQTYETNYHKTGFTKVNLKRELEILNLKIKSIDREGYNLKMIGIK